VTTDGGSHGKFVTDHDEVQRVRPAVIEFCLDSVKMVDQMVVKTNMLRAYRAHQ
jgi:hypothetical protein